MGYDIKMGNEIFILSRSGAPLTNAIIKVIFECYL